MLTYEPRLDDPDRVGRITVDGRVIAQNIKYDPFGDWNEMLLGNGMTAIFDRDKRYSPTRVAYINPYHLDYRYSTGPAGNITEIDDVLEVDPETGTHYWLRNFTYDPLNRLETSTNGYFVANQAYAYDAAGNRTTLDWDSVNETYTYGYDVDGTGNQLKEVDPPAEPKPIIYMTGHEFELAYKEFQREYRALLQKFKVWANQGYDEGDRYLEDFQPLYTLNELGFELELFNAKYGLDMNWWIAQVKIDPYVSELFFQFMSLLLESNAGRYGEILSDAERWYVNELVREAKKIDPIPPPIWEIIGSTGGTFSALSAVGGGSALNITLSYEQNGNINQAVVDDAGTVTQYDLVYGAANRLISLNIAGNPTASYNYNYMNQRVRKSTIIPPESRAFLYDLTGNLIHEEPQYGDWREYIYLGGHRLAKIKPAAVPGGSGCQGGCSIFQGNNWQSSAVSGFINISPAIIITLWFCRKKKRRLKGIIIISALSAAVIGLSYISSESQTAGYFEIEYYLNDHLDTPMRMVDEYGNLIYDVKYDPFGNVVAEESPIQNNFRFPGQYHDRESGLYYNWNRYYIPQFGRYTQADPLIAQKPILIYKPQFNGYIYSANNPLTNLDPNALVTYGTDGRIPIDYWSDLAWAIESAYDYAGTDCDCQKFLKQHFGDENYLQNGLNKMVLNFANTSQHPAIQEKIKYQIEGAFTLVEWGIPTNRTFITRGVLRYSTPGYIRSVLIHEATHIMGNKDEALADATADACGSFKYIYK